MTKQETIQVLQSIEDRAVDFPYMTACDWVAIATAKRHLENSIDAKEVDLDKEIDLVENKYYGFESLSRADIIEIIKYFFELGLVSIIKV